MSNSSCRLLTGHQRPIRTEARGISAHESLTRRARGHRHGQSESTSSRATEHSPGAGWAVRFELPGACGAHRVIPWERHAQTLLSLWRVTTKSYQLVQHVSGRPV